MLLDSFRKCFSVVTHVVQKIFWSSTSIDCVCAMGVFTALHYRNEKRSKILLPFNLFFLIKKFQLAILMDHHFASSTIIQENCFFLVKMLVNVNQYRAAIGVFNNNSFITTKNPFYATVTNNVSKMYSPLIIVVLFFSSPSWLHFPFTKNIEKICSSQLYWLF